MRYAYVASMVADRDQLGHGPVDTEWLIDSRPSLEPVVLVVGLAVFGLGLGAVTPNLMSAALGSVPRNRTGAAAGVFSTARHVGSICSTGLIAAVVADDASGTSIVLAAGAGCLVVAALAAFRVGGTHSVEPGV